MPTTSLTPLSCSVVPRSEQMRAVHLHPPIHPSVCLPMQPVCSRERLEPLVHPTNGSQPFPWAETLLCSPARHAGSAEQRPRTGIKLPAAFLFVFLQGFQCGSPLVNPSLLMDGGKSLSSWSTGALTQPPVSGHCMTYNEPTVLGVLGHRMHEYCWIDCELSAAVVLCVSRHKAVLSQSQHGVKGAAVPEEHSAVRATASSARAEQGFIVPRLCAGIVRSRRGSAEQKDGRDQEGEHREPLPTSLCTQTPLHPGPFASKPHCTQIPLHPGPFAPTSICTQASLHPDPIAPRSLCIQAPLHPDSIAPGLLCPLTPLCPDPVMTTPHCSHTPLHTDPAVLRPHCTWPPLLPSPVAAVVLTSIPCPHPGAGDRSWESP